MVHRLLPILLPVLLLLGCAVANDGDQATPPAKTVKGSQPPAKVEALAPEKTASKPAGPAPAPWIVDLPEKGQQPIYGLPLDIHVEDIPVPEEVTRHAAPVPVK